MSYECIAPRDYECPIMDQKKDFQLCVELKCDRCVKYYDFSKCSCGSDEPPALYAEGVARQYVEHKDDNQQIAWKHSPGYAVECKSCGSSTEHFEDPDIAVEAWNSRTV